MKTATKPSIKIEPSLRAAMESVLKEGETIDSFLEQSLLKGVQARKSQQFFLARGLASKLEAEQTGEYISAEQSLAELNSVLEKNRH